MATGGEQQCYAYAVVSMRAATVCCISKQGVRVSAIAIGHYKSLTPNP